MRQTILRLTIVILSSMMVATSFVACGDDEEKTPIVEPVQNDTQVEAQAIDLGLPSGTKWANMNVGATAPWDNGLYFAWGETTGYLGDASDGHSFEWSSYKLWTVGSGTLKKYNSNNDFGIVDNKTTLEAGDDAARVNWGGEWRMPTRKQINELRNSRYTSWVWTSVNGIKGYRVVSIVPGYTDKSIFLPAAGYYVSSELNYMGEYGHYLSSEVDPSSESNDVSYLLFKSTGNGNGSGDRVVGRSIRPVVLLNSIKQ